MSTDYEIETYIPSDVVKLITKIGDMNISDNFVNLKPHIKQKDWIPNVNDIPSSSKNIPIRN